MGLWEKIKKIHDFVHVEPLILLFSIALGIYFSIFQPFVYWRQCLTLWAGVVTNDHLPVSSLEDFCRNLNEDNVTADVLEPVVSLRVLSDGKAMTVKKAQEELSAAVAQFNILLKGRFEYFIERVKKMCNFLLRNTVTLRV